MMKKIMAVVLTVAMVLSMGTVAFADDPVTIKEAIYAYGADHGLSGDALTAWLTRSIDVEVDVEVRESGTTQWKESLTVSERNTGSIPTFDFKATVDMTAVKTAFEDYVAAARRAIGVKGGANADALLAQLDVMPVSGQFTINVVVPEGVTIPASVINGSNMEGFNDEAKALFHEIDRDYDATNRTLTVLIGVGGTGTASQYSATETELETLLGEDLVLECENVQIADFGTYQVKGKFAGETLIDKALYDVNSTDHLVKIKYVSTPMEDGNNPDETEAPYASATVTARRTTGGGGSATSGQNNIEVSFIVDGIVINSLKGENSVTVDLTKVAPEEREGFEFVGWYLDEALTQKAPDSLVVTADTKIYAKWKVKGSSALVTDDHFAYIKGYTDGTVRPNNPILREEVAAIFYRLLTDEARELIYSEVAPFADVPSSKWSVKAIATLANGGYITGRSDGTFAPDANITRAEFATIAARFSGDAEGADVSLSDISGHWAKKYIEVCVANGWITGYKDGTFKPDQNITRAEAMAIVNRMLGRAVDEAGIEAVKSDINMFPDNIENSWCYYIVIEATNAHDFTREDGVTNETWTEITETKIIAD